MAVVHHFYHHALDTTFLVPLNTTMFTFTQDGTGWGLVISRHVAFALIAIYLLMFAVISIVAYKLWQCITGLKWDPTSIADQSALIQKSNLLQGFEGLEYLNWRTLQRYFKSQARELRMLRLGYWRAEEDESIWHGIRFPDANEGMAPFCVTWSRQS